MLVVCRSDEVLACELLEAIRRARRWHLELLTFVRGEFGGRFEHHGGAEVRELLEPSSSVGRERGVARGGDDSLVGGQQVVGVGMKIGDPSDHRGTRHELVAVGGELGEKCRIARIALDERVPRVRVVAPSELPILREVVETDDGVAPTK